MRPIATYSIAARDDTGALGVAVQSHWFNVGAVVPWVEAGVGAVAVQSISPPSTGPRCLDLLRSGRDARETLDEILAGDPDVDFRQISIVDASGGVAVHTGRLCIAEAGDRSGAGFSAQANLMDRPMVWPAMAAAFDRAEGDLADRLLAALPAAEGEGGDIRGRQSAALVVRPAPGSDAPSIDLRVEDARDPLGELTRLLLLNRAYAALNLGDAMIAAGRFAEALDAYERGTEIVDDEATDGEAPFWAGIGLATTGRIEEAEAFLVRASRFGDRWSRLLPRLVRSRMLPDDADLLQRLTRSARPQDHQPGT
jgi:uncharacterized Ntn-hydrolase superfamily protein